MTIHQLPGTALAPATMLASALETAADLDAAVLLMLNKSGNFTISASHISTERMAFLALMFQVWLHDVYSGRKEV